MTLAKVLSSIVASEKNESLRARKIFLVQPVDAEFKHLPGAPGIPFLAIDDVQAGEGDIVIICREGNGCRQIMSDDQAPVNCVIAGIVDHVENTSPRIWPGLKS